MQRILFGALFVAWFAASVPAAEVSVAAAEAHVAWDLERLARSPQVYPAPGFEAEGVKALFYEGLPYRGQPTRVFAWYGAPAVNDGRRVPAMVLVHGGGGTAFDEWVRLWVSRGYAAIAMDLCGCVPGGSHDGRPRHAQGGPPGWGGFDQIDGAIEDQWTYHAIADITLATSLLRSLPEVDPHRIGITGISWGGYLTSIAAGVDDRLRFAAPVYGCGFLGENSAWLETFASLGAERASKWLSLWDPSRYLPRARMPFLWVTGTNDFAYPLDSLRKSYLLPPGDRTLAVRLRMPHAHGGPGENPEEIRVFADSILAGGKALPRIEAQGFDGSRAWAWFTTEVPLRSAEILWTSGRGRWQSRAWSAAPAELDALEGRASAVVPWGASTFYLNLVDERGCVVSTRHVDVPPPNFVFLLLDDGRWDALGVTGNRFAHTPAIDRLGRGGVIFSNAFCTTSICATSRATLLLGQYASRHGIHDFARGFSPEQLASSFPSILRKHGYRTGFIGKWGVGTDLPRGEYDVFEGFAGQGFYFEKGRPDHLTDVQGEAALRFLDGVDAAKPFCLQVSFKAPHVQDGDDSWPFQPAKRFEALYSAETVPLPPTATEAHFQALPDFLRPSEGRVRWKVRFSNPELAEKSLEDYHRLIAGVDEVTGWIVRKLEERGLAERTVIVIAADNGFLLGDHGLAGKWIPYEESIRIPLVIFDPRLPRARAGSRVEGMALSIDLAPTFLDLAGIEAPPSMQGRSLAPLLAGASVPWREAWYYEHRFEHAKIPKSEAVRTPRRLYARYHELDRLAVPPADGAPEFEQLFDLERDGLEGRNVAGEAGREAELESLRGLLRKLREEAR